MNTQELKKKFESGGFLESHEVRALFDEIEAKEVVIEALTAQVLMYAKE